MKDLNSYRNFEHYYNDLFRHHFKFLCYFASKIVNDKFEPEDIVMDCFERIWKRKAKIEDPEKLKSYLYASVRNACYEAFRKAKKNNEDILPEDIEIMDEDADFLKAVIQTEVLREILNESDKLPPQIKKVFELYFKEGKSEKEISEQLGTSYHTVRGQRQRAIQIIKEKLWPKNLNDPKKQKRFTFSDWIAQTLFGRPALG